MQFKLWFDLCVSRIGMNVYHDARSLVRFLIRPVHKALPGLYMLCEAQHHGKEDSGEVVLVGAWEVSDGPVLTAEPIVRRPR